MKSTFLPGRHQDASAAIRGYIYQIDRTVARWLELQSNQTLELECGEDIDVLAQFVLADNLSGETRLLEQVKHRERRLTLRSDCALEALVNFHTHCAANPQLDLRFSFVTNAGIGHEQMDPFPGGTPGLALWEQLRRGELASDEIPRAVSAIRQFLTSLAKPSRLASPGWAAFQAFVAACTSKELLAFVSRVEWVTDGPGAAQTPSELQRKLQLLRLAGNDAESRELRDRLFMHVARLLCNRGPKQLTRADLQRVLSEPTLAAGDRDLLRRLDIVAAEHSGRLEQLETQVLELDEQVTGLILENAEKTQIDTQIESVEITVPPKLPKHSPRLTTITELERVLADHTWLAIYGGPDVGKSQLGVLLAEQSTRCRGWVRLNHEHTVGEAVRVLELSLIQATGVEKRRQISGWHAGVAASVGNRGIIILDDMPRMTGDDQLAQALILLGRACKGVGAEILSTSHFPLPPRIRYELGNDSVYERPAPMFTDEEARELFKAHGAPERLVLSRAVTFMNALAAGHPLLLTATAEFLRRNQWNYREQEALALLEGDHTRQIVPLVLSRLTATLGDAQRELLYRLTLPIGSFTETELTALAAIIPAIERPMERFNDILGAWVQHDSQTQLNVSPVVKPLGKTELMEETQRRCYRKLADLITDRKKMDYSEADRAIMYNLLAKEFGRAATLYLMLLVEVIRRPRADYIGEVIDKWRNTHLPVEMDVGTRLCVRAYQLAAFTKYEYEVWFVIQEIDDLLERASERDSWGIVAVALQTSIHYASQDIDRVLGYVIRAVKLQMVYHLNGREIKFSKHFPPDLLWTLVPRLDTPQRLNRWLSAVEGLSEEHRRRLFGSKLAKRGMQLAPNRLYLSEWDKEPGQRDWSHVLSVLSDLQQRAAKMQQPLLEAAAARLIICIHGDQKDLEAMARDAQTILSGWPNHEEVRFLVLGEWGRQYSYNGRHDQARPLLKAAIEAKCTDYDHDRVLTLLGASAPSTLNIGVASFVGNWETFEDKEVSHEQEVHRSFVG